MRVFPSIPVVLSFLLAATASYAKPEASIIWYPSQDAVAISCAFPAASAPPMLLDVDHENGMRLSVPVEGGHAATNDDSIIIHDLVKLPKAIPDGKLHLLLKQRAPQGQYAILAEKSVNRKSYPWFATALGHDDLLLPGFTPVSVEGDNVDVIGRTYAFGTTGLPSSILSLGKEILAGAISLVAVSNDMEFVLSGGKLNIRTLSGTTAKFEANSTDMHIDGIVEQDGLIKLRIDFAARLNADRVFMRIPIKRDFATLYHACAGSEIRANPAGAIPNGIGRVFGSRDIPRKGGCVLGWHGPSTSWQKRYKDSGADNFIPYCWVGSDERGIAFAADNDRGWTHCDERDAVELLRLANGDVELLLNLVNTSDAAGRSISLWLQASPAKPLPEGWRSWCDTYYEYRCSRAMLNLASNPYWGCYIAGTARYPTFMDFGFVRKLRETVETGTIDEKYLDRWIGRCIDAYDSGGEEVAWLASKPREEMLKTLKAHAGASFNLARSLHGKPDPTLYYYTCDADPCSGLYEMPTMQDEWTDYTGVFGSHQDYAIYYLDKMLEAGMDGVYNDNSFPCLNFDWVTGGAWIDEKGTVHPSYSMNSSREYRKREAIVMHKRGMRPWIVVHNTNANVIPTLSFATAAMGMEWKYGNAEFQERYSPEYIRAVNQGLQAGTYPMALEGIFDTKDDDERKWLSRTMLAVFLPHELHPVLQYRSDYKSYISLMGKMAAFGVADPRTEYHAYWDPANPVKSPRTDILVSTYRRGDNMLVVIGSLANDDVEINLGIAKDAGSLIDAETGEELNSGKVLVRRRDYKVLELRPFD